ncbi:hypothetical protein NMR73_001587 [Vibrio navarrensis]|nr:hypothetical protein [Vibrio navarrensis]EJL6565989.1 hypothetical protein [Vibrio navarrensis]
MNRFQVTLIFHSEWHVGSGEEGGAYADALVLKDSLNLPYLPGKALKGLFRDAFVTACENGWFAGALNSQVVASLFGHEGEKEQTNAALSFCNAQLSAPEQAYFQQNPEQTRHLYRVHHSTAIDSQTGVALQTSLRALEVAVPVVLYAQIEVDVARLEHAVAASIGEWLDACSALIFELGAKRTRGLGQVSLSIAPQGVTG